MMEKNLRQMLVFARVVEAGSFSEAARRLGMSKAAVSQQVKQLERAHEVQLLHRTTRQLSLTEAGSRYYASCALIAEEVVSANLSLAQLKQQPVGKLKLAVSSNFGQRHFIPALVAFRKQYPSIDIELLVSDQFADLVGEGIDVAVRGGTLPDTGRVARRLLTHPVLLCASREYLQGRTLPTTAHELLQHEWIICTNAPGPYRLHLEKDGHKQVLSINGGIVTDSASARLEFLFRGMGVARVSFFDVRDALASGEMIQLLPDYRLPGTQVYLVFGERNLQTQKILVFVDFMLNWFKTHYEIAPVQVVEG